MAINHRRLIFPRFFGVLGVAMAAPGMIHPVDVVKSRIQALPTSCSYQECRLTGDYGYPWCIAHGRLILKAVDEL